MDVLPSVLSLALSPLALPLKIPRAATGHNYQERSNSEQPIRFRLVLGTVLHQFPC